MIVVSSTTWGYVVVDIIIAFINITIFNLVGRTSEGRGRDVQIRNIMGQLLAIQHDERQCVIEIVFSSVKA